MSWRSCFLHAAPFCLKEQLIDKLWLFRLEYLADIFFKVKKVSCHFKKNNTQYLLPMKKFELSSKIRILENISTTVRMTVFQYLKTYLMRQVLILMHVIFWYYMMQCISIWMICITQWIDISKFLMQSYYKIIPVRDPFKV